MMSCGVVGEGKVGFAIPENERSFKIATGDGDFQEESF